MVYQKHLAIMEEKEKPQRFGALDLEKR